MISSARESSRPCPNPSNSDNVTDITETSTTPSSSTIIILWPKDANDYTADITCLETIMATVDLGATTSSHANSEWFVVIAGVETGVFQGW